jgi:hypothetical protein
MANPLQEHKITNHPILLKLVLFTDNEYPSSVPNQFPIRPDKLDIAIINE